MGKAGRHVPRVSPSASPDFVFIKSDKEFYRVDLADIRYLKADDNYVSIYTPEQRHLALGTLQQWQIDLPAEFVRIHKSYLVNLRHVGRIAGNRLFVEEEELPIGRTYKEEVLRRIERNDD